MSDLLICGLDFETTGLDLERDRIVEIGAVLWDAREKAPMRMLNVLIHRADCSIPAEVAAIHGISNEMTKTYGVSEDSAFVSLLDMFASSVAVVAHNGTGFDKPMLENHLKRIGGPILKQPWIDTCVDVPYPPRITTRSLMHLAAEHGFLNPFAHRALFDVLTMLKVLSCYDIDAVLETAKQPTVTVIAQFNYDERLVALVKGRGYRWKAERKMWVKHVKANAVEAEKAACGFPLTVKEFDPS